MKYTVYFLFLFFAAVAAAQVPPRDTVIAQQRPPLIKTARPAGVRTDSIGLKAQGPVAIAPAVDTMPVLQPAGPFVAGTGRLSYKAVLKINPYFNFFVPPQNLVADERSPAGQEALFYILAGLLFFFALVKLLFNKYVSNLLGLVFRGSLRQKQIREQLLQTPLPSLFLNIFFVIVAGLYIFFLLQHYNTAPVNGFWLLLLYCIVAVGLVYLVKFLILKFTGWIFNIRDAADTYIFIVFLVNKLLAIFLLPLLIVMSFSMASWANVLLTLSYVMIGAFFTYRYIVSFAPVRREVKVSQFHFFMYLCAFEIIPLLLIYKVLLRFF
ncbi:MAG: DUF4271 domain-containing protein [Chitinophagaceae bacterium]